LIQQGMIRNATGPQQPLIRVDLGLYIFGR
jgi:hypothetical protein